MKGGRCRGAPGVLLSDRQVLQGEHLGDEIAQQSCDFGQRDHAMKHIDVLGMNRKHSSFLLTTFIVLVFTDNEQINKQKDITR